MDIILTTHRVSANRPELLKQICSGLRLLPKNDIPPDMRITILVTGHTDHAVGALNKYGIVVLVSDADVQVPVGITVCRHGNITQAICDRVMSSDFIETHTIVKG